MLKGDNKPPQASRVERRAAALWPWAAMVRASQSAQTAKPLELGAQLLCRWRDTEVKPCEVLERQQNEDTGDWEYCAPAIY